MKHTILIVDDTTTNIDVLKSVLEVDYDIKAAKSGAVALKIAEKFNPSIILLDIMMPEMNGYEVCKKLKENPLTLHIPVIFVTAMSEVQDEAKGFEVGAVDYITKPISPMIVKARIKNHLHLADQKLALEELVQERTKEIEESRTELVNILSTVSEFKDFDTGKHVIRVGRYVKELAIALNISIEEAELMSLAASMHDVGKIGIDDSILKKPGKFTDEERDLMQSHSLMGKDILQTAHNKLLQVAGVMAESHHEQWDGSGYPYGLKGEAIPLYGRVCGIADVFDALTSDRTYKDKWEFEDAYDHILELSGSHFDPNLVEVFLSIKPTIKEIHDMLKD